MEFVGPGSCLAAVIIIICSSRRRRCRLRRNAVGRPVGGGCGPGVALKVMRMFKCRMIEGRYWLEADMRLECYTGEWAGYVVADVNVQPPR